ncbi:MAG: hypothetical protein ACRDS9_04170 [Pseudonocardiaceae bacterium]
MAVAFQALTFDFDESKGAIQELEDTASFGRRIRVAEAVLQTFDVLYTRVDAELHRFMIFIDVVDVDESAGNVRVRVRYLLRDKSGNIDDPFRGRITAIVIADTV